MNTLLRSFFTLLPYVCVFAGGLWIAQTPDIYAMVPQSVWLYAPFGLAIIGVLVSTFFQRANLAFGFISCAIVYFALTNPIQHELYLSVILPGISLLFCLFMVAFCLMEDRGVLTPSGIGKMIALSLAGFLLFAGAFGEQARYAPILFDLLHYDPIGLPQKRLLPFGLPAHIMFGLSLLVINAKFLWSKRPSDLAWAFCLFSMGWAATQGPQGFQVFALIAMCGLMVGIAQDIYRMAFMDELTGIPARRALIADMKKLGSTYTIAMSDIDHFKKFNDTHGHDVGDQVLKMVATQLSKISGGGKAYRYGGEEFTLLFPNTTVEQAEPHLEKIRDAVEKAKFTLRGSDRPKKKPKQGAKKAAKPANKILSVTISIGASEKQSSHKDPMAVMKSADEALYRAKKAGRNQVSL